MSPRRGITATLILALSLGMAPLAFAADPASLPDWLRYAAAENPTSLPSAIPPLGDERRKAHAAEEFGWVTLLRRVELDVDDAGRLVERVTIAFEYLTEEGIRQVGNDEITLRPLFEQIRILAAVSFPPDGDRSIPVAADTLKIVPATSTDIFSDAQTIVVPHAGLRVGSVSLLIFEREIDTRRWPLPWSRIYHVQSAAPIERFELELRWSADTEQPQWGWDLPQGECERGGDRRFTCSASAIEALANDPDVASWADVLPVIVIGEPSSWRDLADLEAEIVEESVRSFRGTHPSMRGATPRERLDSVYRFVSDRIRYVAFEEGDGAVRPRPAALTLSRGYGDCKDKVALFVALARAAGLDAYPVLVASNRYDTERMILPSWRFFDHMMACVDGIERSRICLELTTAHANVGELPLFLGGAVMLPLAKRDGIPQFPVNLPSARFGYDVSIEAHNVIECRGSLEERLRITYRGSMAVWLRSTVSGMTAEQRDEFLADFYADATGYDIEVKARLNGLADPRAPLVLETRAEFPVSSISEWSYVDDGDPWLAYYATALASENRVHDLRVLGARIVSESFYEMCEEIDVLDGGTEVALESEFGSFERQFRRSEGGVTVRSMIELPRGTVEAPQLDRFRKFINALVATAPYRIFVEVEQ